MSTNYSIELNDALRDLQELMYSFPKKSDQAFLRPWIENIVDKQLLVKACQYAIHEKDYALLETWQRDFAECDDFLKNFRPEKQVSQHPTWLDAIFACARAAASAKLQPYNLSAFGEPAWRAIQGFAALQGVQLPTTLPNPPQWWPEVSPENATSLVDAGYAFFAQQGCPVGAAYELTRWLLGEERPAEFTRQLSVLGCSDDHQHGWVMRLTVSLVRNGHGEFYGELPAMAFAELDADFQAALSHAWQSARAVLLAGMDVRFSLQVPQPIHTHRGGSLGGAFAVALGHLFQDKPIPRDIAITADVTETGELRPVTLESIHPKIKAAIDARLSTLIVHPDNEAVARSAAHGALAIQTASTVEGATEILAAALLPNKLPPPPDIFVGRADLLAELHERIDTGGVTILKGEGGIGKTALALTAAHAAYNDGVLPGGVAWLNCELQPSRDECLRQMAHIFFGDRLEQDPIERCHERVMKHLRERNALVVFDSFEAVASDDALLRWLADVRAPARVLVTTREVPSGLHGQVIDVRELPREEALELFIVRAKAAGWDGYGSDKVNDLCAAVGDLPLAIELLAARAARLPLPRLLEQVRRDLEVLKKKDPTRPDRHQSVWACFALSYEQLSTAARDLLLRLSVLPDGAGVEVITAVMETDNWDKAAEELVAASVWRLVGARYTVHPLVRQFALEKLRKRRAAIELRAARAVTRLAQAKGELTKPGAAASAEMVAALDWIEAEWLNLLACADFAFAAEDWATVGDLSDAVRELFLVRGYWQDCENLYRQALTSRRNAGDRVGEGRTLNTLGAVYRLQGQLAEAEVAYQQSLATRQEVGDRFGEGRTLNNLGEIYRLQGQWADAEEHYQQSLTISQEVGDRVGEGITLNNLGLVYQAQGHWAEAEKCYQQDLALCREVGDRVGEGIALTHLGNIYDSQGQWAEAEKCQQQSLVICRSLGDRFSEGKTLNNLGIVYQHQGRWVEAEECHQQSLAIKREFGDRVGKGITFNNLGEVYRHQGRWAEAEAAYQQSLVIRREVGDRVGEGETLNNFGEVYRLQGRWAEAETMYQQSLAIKRELGNRIGEGETLKNFAELRVAQGDMAGALALGRQAVTILETTEDTQTLAEVRQLVAKWEGQG